jgi:hypothetical protein
MDDAFGYYVELGAQPTVKLEALDNPILRIDRGSTLQVDNNPSQQGNALRSD